MTWPRWGFMHDGVCWALDTLARHINAIGSGSSPDRILPTPTAFDATGNVKQKPTTDRGWMGSLRQQEARLRRWETPSKADAHPRAYNRTGPYTGPHPQKHLQAQAFERSIELDSPSGKLNPTWVEWLMGWPMRWTDLPPLETDKFQQWCALHGRCWPDAHGIQAEEPPAPAEGR